jgi:hypothetical protein
MRQTAFRISSVRRSLAKASFAGSAGYPARRAASIQPEGFTMASDQTMRPR